MKPLYSVSQELFDQAKIVDWGYTEVMEPLSFKKFESWVADGGHGPLKYLADERKDKRKHLSAVYPEVQSALVFLFDYSGTKKTLDELGPQNKLASYTLGFDGDDYHFWIKDKLEKVTAELKKDIEGLETAISLDVHPVLERDLAYRSGMGWFGKNSMLINREFGSYFLIGSLLLNKKLDLDTREVEIDHCGNCTRCIDACPTTAITDMRTIESEKCISTYTIELFKDAPAPKGFPTETNEMFGCDICQEVCPWNVKPLKRTNLVPIESDSLINFFNREISEIYQDISEMSNNQYKRFFKGTSFERLGKRGLLKNLEKFI